MVHEGTSDDGHYFSYIKSEKNGTWYLFDDENVKKADEDFLNSCYGVRYSLFNRRVIQRHMY